MLLKIAHRGRYYVVNGCFAVESDVSGSNTCVAK